MGSWAAAKHAYISSYLHATRAIGAEFLPPKGSGGAAFIDLFAGPGRARPRDERQTVAGSPLVALENTEAPFSRVVMCELLQENIDALRTRTARFGPRAVVVPGDCNLQIDTICASVPRHGLNLALVDPYGLAPLRFATLRALAQFPRMDFIIHFPTHAIRRNWHLPKWREVTSSLIGRDVVTEPVGQVMCFAEDLRRRLMEFGYMQGEVRMRAVKNDQGGVLYHLLFASKHPKGEKIWNDVVRRDAATGQGSLF